MAGEIGADRLGSAPTAARRTASAGGRSGASRTSVLVGGVAREGIRGAGANLQIPAPLTGGAKIEEAPLSAVPTTEALATWLTDRGCDTKSWGEGDTKDVGKYWKELEGKEAGLETWRFANGKRQPVRVVHVLRAKVCSPESYKRGIFLFNTWQQFGDGRVRTRNGLLSEKLTVDEMPLEDHLHEVCARAVTEEEMQRVCESALKIGPGSPAPTFDPSYKCPLTVLEEKFVDHTIEIETSKSYPGLLTMYHLYTVDIVCSGLPAVDFNTLEFGAEKKGTKPLKYIHAWIWLEWSQIQRYLLEGSVLKERKKKASFDNSLQLFLWLSQFDMDLEAWGNSTYNSIDNLFDELENEDSHLELWGRHDGVPLLMRVVHAMQLKVCSTDPRHCGNFLYNTWRQSRNGTTSSPNRLMARKMSTADLPFDEERFNATAKQACAEELSFIVDAHFELDPKRIPTQDKLIRSDVTVVSAMFEDHRVTVEESMSYKGLHTMYHLYSMQVECEGVPLADFGSLEFRKGKSGPELRNANGWRWVALEQTLDILQSRIKNLEQRQSGRAAWERQTSSLTKSMDQARGLAPMLARAAATLGADPLVAEAQRLHSELLESLAGLHHKASASQQRSQEAASANLAKVLPPSMLSKMSEQGGQVLSKAVVEQAEQRQMMEAQASRAMRGRGSTTSTYSYTGSYIGHAGHRAGGLSVASMGSVIESTVLTTPPMPPPGSVCKESLTI